jgi:thymidylate synthase (FAD)
MRLIMIYNVLDHGSVELIGKMLSVDEDKNHAQSLDEMCVENARVSYGTGLKGEEKDRKLLHYLLEHEHLTPLESATLKFEIKLPLFCMQQFLRHRWSSFNQISGRYTEEISEEFYVPEKFRAQDTKNKQGSTDTDLSEHYCEVWPLRLDFPLDIAKINDEAKANIKQVYTQLLLTQQEMYRRLIENGVAKELARGVLGTAFYTKFVWTVNARSLINFLILRLDAHAQWEIQQYARVIAIILKHEMPWTYESLTKLFPNTPWP